jgi:hypothetical protein
VRQCTSDHASARCICILPKACLCNQAAPISSHDSGNTRLPLLHVRRLNWRQGALLVHSGLRGSVALVLALIVDGLEEVRSVINFNVNDLHVCAAEAGGVGVLRLPPALAPPCVCAVYVPFMAHCGATHIMRQAIAGLIGDHVGCMSQWRRLASL